VWTYCTQCKWIDIDYEVDSMQGDLHVVTEKKNGKQHNILVGGALERQRHRTAPPGQSTLVEPELERRVKPAMTSKQQYEVLCPGFEKYVEETPETQTEVLAVQVAEEEPVLVSLESLLEDQEAEQDAYESDGHFSEEPLAVVINPNDWFELTVKRNRPNEPYMIARTSTNESVYVSKTLRHRVCPSQHTCPHYIFVGTKMYARLKLQDDPSVVSCAFEALGFITEDSNPSSHETGYVFTWDERKHFGSIVRPCECVIFASSKHKLFLKKGEAVEFDIERRDAQDDGYFATNIKSLGTGE
jgi:hypothetical protein